MPSHLSSSSCFLAKHNLKIWALILFNQTDMDVRTVNLTWNEKCCLKNFTGAKQTNSPIKRSRSLSKFNCSVVLSTAAGTLGNLKQNCTIKKVFVSDLWQMIFLFLLHKETWWCRTNSCLIFPSNFLRLFFSLHVHVLWECFPQRWRGCTYIKHR